MIVEPFNAGEIARINRNVRKQMKAFEESGNKPSMTDHERHLLVISLMSFVVTIARDFDRARKPGWEIALPSKGLKFENYSDLFVHYIKNGKIREI